MLLAIPTRQCHTKVKLTLQHTMKAQRDIKHIDVLFFSISSLDGGGWLTPRFGPFTNGNDPVPIVYEAVWTPGQVWTEAENLAATGIRSPDRPAQSESLYRLHHTGPMRAPLACLFVWMPDIVMAHVTGCSRWHHSFFYVIPGSDISSQTSDPVWSLWCFPLVSQCAE